jgi:hypothetical protein
MSRQHVLSFCSPYLFLFVVVTQNYKALIQIFFMSFSPQPQILRVHPTPRSPADGYNPPTSSPPPATQSLGALHNHSTNSSGAPGGVVTRHHVWTIGTGKRNTKSALRSSALARHQQQLQEGRSPDGLGDAENPASFDQQVHYGVAGYRADGGGVSFYRTSVHRKDPQNIVLSHGVMTRVVDLNRMPLSSPPPHTAAAAQRHARTLSGGSIGDDASTTPPPMLARYDSSQPYASPWSPRNDDGTVSLEEGRSATHHHHDPRTNSNQHRSRSPSHKPRWNTSGKVAGARGGSPPPLAAEGGPTTTSETRGAHVSAAPSRTGTRASSQSALPRERGGISPQAIRSALAGGGRGSAPPEAPLRATSVTKVNVASPPRTHLQTTSGSPPGPWQRVAAGGGMSSRASNASLPPAFLPLHQTSQNMPHSTSVNHGGRPTSTHDCRDSRCLHSRGDIVEVIAAKSQVRAMESHLLHEEIRREQLATALSSERERNVQLSQNLARAESSLQASHQQLVDGEHWRSEYDRRHAEATALEANVHVLEATLARHQSTMEQQRAVIQKLEATVLEQSREIDDWGVRYRTLSNQVAEIQQQQQQQQQHNQAAHALHVAAHANTTSRPASPQHSRQFSAGTSADLEAVRQRVSILEAELDRARDEKTADERLRRELLRALSDKERQLVSHGITSNATSGKATPLAHPTIAPSSSFHGQLAIGDRLHSHDDLRPTTSAMKLASPLPAPFSPSTAPQPQRAQRQWETTTSNTVHSAGSSFSASRHATVVTSVVVDRHYSENNIGLTAPPRRKESGDEPFVATTAPRHADNETTPTDSMLLLDVTAASTVDDNQHEISEDGIGVEAPPLLARTSVSHRLF